LVLFVVTLTLVVAPGSAASAPAAVDEARGVKLVRHRGEILVVFTARAARLYRRLAGKRIIIGCTDLPAPEELAGEPNMNDGELHFNAPGRRRPLHTYTLVKSHDFCRIWLAPRVGKRSHRRIGRRLVVSIPLTGLGAMYLDEQVKARRLNHMLLMAATQGDEYAPPRYPLHSELFGGPGQFPLPAWLSPVKLTIPADTPPAGAYGYYSDGQLHAAAVTLSKAGRRLFVELNADVLHTNVADYLVRR
jgi:hypothetical protein